MQIDCTLFPIQMDKNKPPHNLENAAWVTISTKLKLTTLFDFCSKVERLFRLNPYLRIKSWRSAGDSIFDVDWDNHSNEQLLTTVTRIEVAMSENEIRLIYASGIKRETLLLVEESIGGAQLTIIDDYGNSGQQDTQQVDKSLAAWGQALHKYFSRYFYLRHVPFADRIIDQFWLRLSPTGRRITYILLVITVIELAALLLFVLMFWLV